MARKAVAATLASVVLLTVLVVADATVMSAQENLASSAQTSHLESRELLLEESLAGGVSLQVLAQVQGYLSSNPAECDSLPQYFGSIFASSASSGEDSGIAYSANATAAEAPAPQAVESDNLTIVAPFAGGVPGVLDLREDLSVKEVGGGGSVSLQREETHTLNLPVEVDSASSLCASTLASLGAVLSRLALQRDPGAGRLRLGAPGARRGCFRLAVHPDGRLGLRPRLLGGLLAHACGARSRWSDRKL